MRRMARITGRSDDMMIIRGVNVFPSQIEELICQTEGLAPHYQIELTKRGNLDSVTIYVESVKPISHDAQQALEKTLLGKIKTYVGISCAAVITPPYSIDRSEGKAKRVLDNRYRQG
jgi:phenylacetate-CoA ligase